MLSLPSTRTRFCFVAPGIVFAAACAGCSSSDSGGDGGAPAGPPAWQVVFDQSALGRVVLSMWGPSPDDVFAVGGPLGNPGYQTLAIRFDGHAWHDLAPGGTETFWWVGGTSATDVWMVGTNGRIAHWDGQSFTPHASGT